MRQKCILLVEDNEELRRLYKEAFKHHGFTVFESGDGLSAIDVALNNSPDVILLDLMLPRQGGLGALKIFRTLPETKHIPIIILTALPNPDYKEQAKNRVQGYYLKTEITPKELVAKVRELID
ncbi:MAG: response regulator [bacterium]|nr:response regulator [bacterium]